jgi:AmmeMemoRadiSam system protein B
MSIVLGCITPHPPIIVPEVGKGGEAGVSATTIAMKQLADIMSDKRPEAALVISPHGKSTAEAMGILTAPSSSGDMRVWGAQTPHQEYPNDPELVQLIQAEAAKAGVPLASLGRNDYDLDWGVMVPLYFLGRALKGASLVPLTFSWLPWKTHFEFGKAIRKAVEQSCKRVAIIASGDLSHRLIPGAPAGYDPKGKIFDEQLVKAISCLDTKHILSFDPELVERAGECGLRSITILMGALEGLKVKPEVLSYEGPFGVGYMVASLEIIS